MQVGAPFHHLNPLAAVRCHAIGGDRMSSIREHDRLKTMELLSDDKAAPKKLKAASGEVKAVYLPDYDQGGKAGCDLSVVPELHLKHVSGQDNRADC